MRELRGLRKGFDRRLGWTHDNAFALVTKCLMYLQTLDKKRFKMFYSWADLAAWKKLRGETYQIPEPVQLCNQYCAESILAWYVTHYPDVIDEAHYHFDRAEQFKGSFEKKWNDEKDRAHENGDLSPWSVIRKIEEVDMRRTPGIQAADILAWAANREATGTQGPGQNLCHIMRQIIPSLYRPWDETSMRQYFRPLLHLPGR
jgi:hypothetical protein